MHKEWKVSDAERGWCLFPLTIHCLASSCKPLPPSSLLATPLLPAEGCRIPDLQKPFLCDARRGLLGMAGIRLEEVFRWRLWGGASPIWERFKMLYHLRPGCEGIPSIMAESGLENLESFLNTPNNSKSLKKDVAPSSWGVASSFQRNRVTDPSMNLTIWNFWGDT